MKLKTLSSNIEAVIFDLDGTLTDSMWMWTDIDKEYLSRFGYKVDEQLQIDIAGMGMKETAVYFKNRYNIPHTLDQIISEWIRMSLDKYEHSVPLKPHAGELLTFLRNNGIRTAIASSNATQMIEACLKANSVLDKFDKIVTSDEVEHGKPFPDVYLYAAECLNVSPEKCLVFEDIPAGILAGKRAGMSVVAVHDRFSEKADEEKHKLADRYYHGFYDFMRFEFGM